jgi:hypothetical protein
MLVQCHTLKLGFVVRDLARFARVSQPKRAKARTTNPHFNCVPALAAHALQIRLSPVRLFLGLV